MSLNIRWNLKSRKVPLYLIFKDRVPIPVIPYNESDESDNFEVEMLLIPATKWTSFNFSNSHYEYQIISNRSTTKEEAHQVCKGMNAR